MNLSGNLESGNNSYRNSSDLSDDSSASYHPSQERIIDEDDEEYTEEDADDDREEVFPDMLGIYYNMFLPDFFFVLSLRFNINQILTVYLIPTLSSC